MIEHFAPDYSYDKLVTQLLRVVENPGKSPRSEIVSALAEIGHVAPARAQSDDDDPLTEADDAPHITIPVSTTMNDVLYSATLSIWRNKDGALDAFHMISEFGDMWFDPPPLVEITRAALHAWAITTLRGVIADCGEQSVEE